MYIDLQRDSIWTHGCEGARNNNRVPRWANVLKFAMVRWSANNRAIGDGFRTAFFNSLFARGKSRKNCVIHCAIHHWFCQTCVPSTKFVYGDIVTHVFNMYVCCLQCLCCCLSPRAQPLSNIMFICALLFFKLSALSHLDTTSEIRGHVMFVLYVCMTIM